MYKIAFPFLGRGGWTGGYNYLKNMLNIIQTRLSDRIEAYVFLSPAECEYFGADLSALTEGRLIINPVFSGAGRSKSLLRALFTGKDRELEQFLLAAGINVTFECAAFYGASFSIPAISWIGDLQHRHMPNMFSFANRLRREIGIKTQIMAGRTIMVSSDTARIDLEHFYPALVNKSYVVRFAVDLDSEPYLARVEEMQAKYGLPKRFFFLPNQFWKHKNHYVVVEALAKLKVAGRLDTIPPVILTGESFDTRHPRHFDELMSDVNQAGITGHFRFLGLIPYDDVLALNASCDAMINPSFFEGWSTPVEEAKALGTPLILSDIAVHREQAPDAVFFHSRSSVALSRALIDHAANTPPKRPKRSTLLAAQDARLNEYALALLQTVAAAASSRKSS